MRITCQQSDLARGLATVSRAASSRSTLPILANLLLETGPDMLILSATNLEIGIIVRLAARVESEGKITLPAGLFTDFIKSQPGGDITLAVADGETTAHITGKLSRASMRGIDALEFPKIPTVDELSSEPFTLSAACLKEIIKNVAFAAADDESRPALTGVYTQVDETGVLTCVAVDAFRLAKRQVQLSGTEIPPVHFLVPARSLTDLAHILPDDEEVLVDIILTEQRNQVLFHSEQVDLVSRLVEASFPPWADVFPKHCGTSAVLDTHAFTAAVKSAQLFARSSGYTLCIEVRPAGEQEEMGQVQIEAQSPDLGESVSTLDALVTGPGLQIKFSSKYLVDILAAISTEKTLLELSSSVKPGVLKPVGDLEQSYVVMPIYLKK